MPTLEEKEKQFYEAEAILNSLAIFTDQNVLDAIVDPVNETLEESLDGFFDVLRKHISHLSSILIPENSNADR